MTQRAGDGPGAMTTAAVYQAFLSDFGDAWDAIGRSDAGGRGNFMFAMLSLTFFEWCARIIHDEPGARAAFVRSLNGADAFYFSRLPTPYKQKPEPWFPTLSGDARHEWLWLAFDVLRNGLSHRYQQPDITLNPGGYLRFGVSGPETPLHRIGPRRPASYLRQVTGAGVGPFVYLVFHPDVFFHDVREAARAARVTSFPTPSWSRPTYNVSLSDLAASLPPREEGRA